MKNITLLAFFTLFIFIGCQDDSSILEPFNDYSSNDDLSKGRPILSLDSGDLITTDDDNDNFGDLEEDYEIIKPGLGKKVNSGHEKFKSKKILVKTKHSKILTINSEKGGKVYLKHKWKNENNELAKLTAVLDIPEGAFSGDLTFEIIFDLENYAVELYPSPYKFGKPLLLDLIFENVDLTNFDPNVFVFDYLDGEQENIKYKSIDIRLDQGSVRVREAELNHFSRYGWTRNKNKNK